MNITFVVLQSIHILNKHKIIELHRIDIEYLECCSICIRTDSSKLISFLTFWVGFLETIGSIYIVGGCIMSTASFGVKVCSITKCVSRMPPLLCHLKQIGCSLVTFHCFLNFGWAPVYNTNDLWHNLQNLKSVTWKTVRIIECFSVILIE